MPKTWPLARLTIPLSGFSKHLERLLEGYCLEVYATNVYPDEQLGSIKAYAKDLVLLLAFHLAERIATLFLPQFWLLPIYRELLNTASRNRPSRDSEVRRAASGLVKVLCKVNDSAAGGKGSQRGQPLKQGGALARFNEWFGSMSLMNTLYVWFPASWGPSVVEAISKRNQTWLQQHPVHRDPAMFNASEVEYGPASREMTYKIQKWNVKSLEVHPILVANARVDWMSLDDSELTQQFEILREGILRDVFSQRASSAWQGMQPQRLTVSLLLPGRSKADQWLDFLQSQCQFWPTMTTRHASLAPIRMHTFQRERRLMQSKHLWDTLSIDWNKLYWKLYTYKPTGLSRVHLWTLSLSTVRILSRSVNIRVLIKRLSIIDGTMTSATCVHTRQPKPSKALILKSLWWASTLTISQRRKHSKTLRTSIPAGGKLKKAPTASRSSFFRMLGILTS